MTVQVTEDTLQQLAVVLKDYEFGGPLNDPELRTTIEV
jgi:hypothetical protein